MKKAFRLLLGGMLLYASPALAQWQLYNAANSGLHSNLVREVATDDNGTVWVATQRAVQKFDGTTWTTYTQADGLNYTAIKCIAVRAGIVWVGTDRGLIRFDGTTWMNFNNAADLPVGLFGPNDLTVNDVVIAADGTIWLAGSRGLGRYDGTTWTKFNSTNSGLKENGVTALALDEGLNTLWIGTNCNSTQSGVYALNTLNTSWRYFNMQGRNCVHGLAVNNTGTVFVGTCNASGLTTIDTASGTLGAVTNSGCVALDGVANDAGTDGRVWVVAEPMGPSGTPKGLLAYDGSSVVQEFNTGNSQLPSANVTTVATQRVGSALRVWVGTFDQGLAVYESVVTSQRRAADVAQLQVSPNPATATVEVRSDVAKGKLTAYDNTGRLVYTGPTEATNFSLDVRSWPSGLYHLRLTSPQGTVTRRLLKQ
jgi:ligand-binding sensor domain-containing protein